MYSTVSRVKTVPAEGSMVLVQEPQSATVSESRRSGKATMQSTPRSILSVSFKGQVTLGAALSRMVMVNGTPVLAFPLISVASEVIVVVPTGKKSPSLWDCVSDRMAQLSVALIVKFTVAPQVFGAELIVMFPDVVMRGGAVSSTVTFQEQVSVLPLSSRWTW